MSMLRALAMVGSAGLAGYQKGMDDKKEQEDRDEERVWRKEQRDRQRKDWAEQDAEKQRIANAAQDVAPVEVKQDRPETMDNRDVGQAGEQALPTAGYDVQGTRYIDRAKAAEGAAKANTPQAKTQRMAAAMQQRSPERAMQLIASARQAEASDMQIERGKIELANEKFESDLNSARTPEALADLISQSQGDNENGAVKVKIIPSADGKGLAMVRVNVDGTVSPAGRTFANLDELKMEMSRRVTPAQRLAHYEGARRYEEELKLKKEAEARRAKTETRMAVAQERTAAAAEAKRAPATVTPDSTFDVKTATIEAQNRIKAMRDERAASGKPMSAQEEAVELQNTIAAYKAVHTQRFIAGAIGSALTKAASDPKAYASEYEAALAMGATPAALTAMGHKPPPGLAAPGAAAPAPAAAATPARPAPGPAAAPAPAAQAQEVPEGATLDAARQRKQAARQTLAAYGSVQRQKDPQGFARAQAELAAASAEADAAEQAWNKVATRMMMVQQGR